MSVRSIAVATLLVGLGAVAAACGDDEATPGTTPANDAGPSSSSSGFTTSSSGSTPQGIAPKITTGATLPALVGGTAAAPLKFSANGDSPFSWAITAGTAPPGMTLSASGDYTGTPTAAGDFSFTVTVTNPAGTDMRAVTQKVSSPPADAIVLLGNDQIASFATSFPQGASVAATVSGLAAGDTLVAIDRRPMNGQLYGLGFDATAKSVTLYALHPATNVAVAVGAPGTFDSDIVGPGFGLDVNPSVDRMRVVTSAGQNFRMNPNTGGLVDADPNSGGAQRDGAINGPATTAAETAYTNNAINNGSITTQYTISGGALYIQNPPNAGTLTSALTIANVGNVFGFDIPPGVVAAASNTAVTSGNGYAVVSLTGQTTQVGGTINLVTGAFTAAGPFAATGIKGLALAQASTRTVIGLSADGTTLLRFSEATPATTTTSTITNVVAGEQIVGIDFRPATGQLYGLGVNATNDTATVYVIDPLSGAASPISASAVAFDGVDLPDPATAGYGFDFNSAVDRIRVVTSTGLNFRAHPGTGAAVDADPNTAGVQPDAALTGGMLDGVAYTNGHPATLPGITSEYGIDAATNSLHLVTNPNGGVLGAAIAIKLGGAALDFTSVAGFDIPQTVTTATANAAVTQGTAYAALVVGGATNLYKIDLVTGTATFVGSIGAGTTMLHGIAVGQ